MDEARLKVGRLLNRGDQEVIFNGLGETESNNLAIKGPRPGEQNRGTGFFFSDIEHYSIMHQADFLKSLGFEIDYVRGRPLRPDRPWRIWRRRQNRERSSASIMLAKPGNRHLSSPCAKSALLLKSRGVLLPRTGRRVAAGIPETSKELSVDSMTVSAHQFTDEGRRRLYLKKASPCGLSCKAASRRWLPGQAPRMYRPSRVSAEASRLAAKR